MAHMNKLIVTTTEGEDTEPMSQHSDTSYVYLERLKLPKEMSAPISKGKGYMPGPACSKVGADRRTRSSSVLSSCSNRSDTSRERDVERMTKRQLVLEASRLGRLAHQNRERASSGDGPDEYSSEEEGDTQTERPNRKRKRATKSAVVEVFDSDEEQAEEKRGRERPPSTGKYVGLAATKENYYSKLREEAEIEAEKRVRSMSSTELYSSMRLDLDGAVEELREAPSADVANRARRCMESALQVAKVRKNFQGTKARGLKQASVVGAAATEVLRSRSDGESDNDIARQVRALRKELEKAREETRLAREETQRLKKELDEERAKRRGRRRRVMRDSPSPPRHQKSLDKETEVPQETQEDANSQEVSSPTIDEPSAMEVEVEASPPIETVGETKKKGKKKVVLPPQGKSGLRSSALPSKAG